MKNFPTQILRAIPQNGVVVKVIAGESRGIKSQVNTHAPTMYLDFKMGTNKTVTQIIPSTYTGFIYMLKGTAFIGDKGFKGKAHHTLTLSEDGATTVKIQTKDEDARFVFINGESLKEPIVQHGPFVMNSSEEIYDTFVDY
ncbi:hypothetical protein BGZ47_007142 [Haplosporangium gracile]|nr:hypothetical protein BGZ47_007142 [Haplosporangium gracile]